MIDHRIFVHRIDEHDCLCFANDDWFAFARENSGDRLRPEAVLGRSLWTFISNLETRMIYELLVRRVRMEGDPITVPYRCDDCTHRRYMEMDIVALPGRCVEFRNRILRVDERRFIPLLDPRVERSKELLRICSWCKKVAVAARKWIEIEEAVVILNLFSCQSLPLITHGICEDCSRPLLEGIPAAPSEG